MSRRPRGPGPGRRAAGRAGAAGTAVLELAPRTQPARATGVPLAVDPTVLARAAGAAHLARAAGVLLALTAGTACMRATPPDRLPARPPAELAPPAPDSATVGLWRLDETGGVIVADAGPFRLEGRAGLDTRTDFGRFQNARLFTRSVESFVLIPYSPLLDPAHEFTIEAWIRLNALGHYEDTPIAARWTLAANEQSWLFGVVGSRLQPPRASLPSPGYHRDLVLLGAPGHLMFAFQPADASASRAFFSNRALELARWTHVAATFDGEVVRLYVDGVLDAQYATAGRIRESPAPLVVGNFLDPRWLSVFGGDLRADQAPDPNPYYAFDGQIDELRLSSVARAGFDVVRR